MLSLKFLKRTALYLFIFFIISGYSLVSAKTTQKVVATRSVKGIVIVPPHTLYTQRSYVQIDSGNTIELYNSKGIFPKMSFGDYVEVQGISLSDTVPPRLKTASKANVRVISSGKIPEFATSTLAELDPADAFSMIQVQGEITRYSKKSLQLTDADAQVMIKMMQSAKLFPKTMAKGTRIQATGFLKYESSSPVVYVPDLNHIQILASANISATPTTTPAERIIEGAVSDNSFSSQWYVVVAVPLVLIAAFAIKKYVVPRLG